VTQRRPSPHTTPEMTLVSQDTPFAKSGCGRAYAWSVCFQTHLCRSGHTADVIQEQSPGDAEKLRCASSHWMRHT